MGNDDSGPLLHELTERCLNKPFAFAIKRASCFIEEGKTGYIVETLDEAVSAVQRIDALDRRSCRTVFEERFSAGRMCADYLAIYRRLCDHEPDLTPRRSVLSTAVARLWP